MKNILLVILFALASDCVFSQIPSASITFHFENINSGEVNVSLPVNHTYFGGNSKHLRITNGHTPVLMLNDEETGFVFIRYHGKTARVFVQKGDSIFIDIDTLSTNLFRFEGSNAAGQTLLSGKSQPASISEITALLKKDSTVGLLSAHISDEKGRKIKLFKNLYTEKKIDKVFLMYMEMNLDYLYAAAAASVIANRSPDREGYAHRYYKASPKAYDDYWKSLFTEFPIDKKDAICVPFYIELANNYLQKFLSSKRRQTHDTAILTDEASKKREIRDVRSSFSENAEYIEAFILSFYYLEQHFEKILPELFADFKKQYPGNPYSEFMEPANEKVKQYYVAIERSFSADEVIVENYKKINSFAELKEKFKGKMFYIDMWASWCGPCKDEFQYKDELVSYLKQKKVELLYLSLDFDDSAKLWEEMIKYFKLSGFHIRANESLYKEIIAMFGMGTSIAIPRYVLVNEKGDIVEKNALRPSSKEQLYNQIASHLP
jgi:thiol-disulfide isomerase/thioredoxin